MSSDIFSRRIDVKRFDMIYAGAQKNMGAAGVTLVIIKKDLLGKVTRKIPVMLDYRVHIEKGSMNNTPPVFPIYVSMLTLRWIKEQGLETLEAKNQASPGFTSRPSSSTRRTSSSTQIGRPQVSSFTR